MSECSQRVREIQRIVERPEAGFDLKRYVTRFDGGQWDTFDPSGTRKTRKDVFTVDDLYSSELLSVGIPGGAGLSILGECADDLSEKLHAVSSDLEFRDVQDVSENSPDYGPVWELWQALHEINGLGPTKISKLMARKRPKLVPIFDSLVKKIYGDDSIYWNVLHEAFHSSEFDLSARLHELRSAVKEVSDEMSDLRILDAVVWTHEYDKQKMARKERKAHSEKPSSESLSNG